MTLRLAPHDAPGEENAGPPESPPPQLLLQIRKARRGQHKISNLASVKAENREFLRLGWGVLRLAPLPEDDGPAPV